MNDLGWKVNNGYNKIIFCFINPPAKNSFDTLKIIIFPFLKGNWDFFLGLKFD